MNIKNKLSTTIILIAAVVPFVANADDVIDQVGQGMSDVGDSFGDAAQDVGNAANDTAITTSVKAKIALDSNLPSGISVTTTNGVVYLSGTAPTKAQYDQLVSTAESVDGVTQVDTSNLKFVKP